MGSLGDIKGDGNYRFQAFLAENFWVADVVGVAGLARGVTGACSSTVVRPEKKTSRGISVDFPKYLGLSLPVCLSGSEQPLDTSQEKSDSDIPFQDGECWDKYGGAGDADQGAGAGEHDFEVSAGQVPDHLQLARRNCRQTGLVSFSFGT